MLELLLKVPKRERSFNLRLYNTQRGRGTKTFLQAINVSPGTGQKGRTTISSPIWANQFRLVPRAFWFSIVPNRMGHYPPRRGFIQAAAVKIPPLRFHDPPPPSLRVDDEKEEKCRGVWRIKYVYKYVRKSERFKNINFLFGWIKNHTKIPWSYYCTKDETKFYKIQCKLILFLLNI